MLSEQDKARQVFKSTAPGTTASAFQKPHKRQTPQYQRVITMEVRWDNFTNTLETRASRRKTSYAPDIGSAGEWVRALSGVSGLLQGSREGCK